MKFFILIKNITFKKPKIIEFLIYSSGHATNDEYLESLLSNFKYSIYKGRASLNLYTLFFTLFTSGISNIKRNYFKNLIIFSNPKVAITLNDTEKKFYNIKKIKKKIILISIQNSLRHDGKLVDDYKNLKFCESDYFFTFGKFWTRVISKSIKSRFIELGSFRNNFYKKKKIKNKNIIFVSIYKQDIYDGIPPGEKKILKFLNLFCLKHGYKLKMFGRGKYTSRVKNVYKTAFNNIKFSFLDNDKAYHSFYKLYQKTNIFVFERSTGAYEALSQGCRVAVFNFNSINKKWYKKYNLEDVFPMNKKKSEGIFWSHNCNYNRFEKIMANIIHMNNKKWRKIVSSKMKETIIYDKNNSKLAKIIKKVNET